MNHFKSLPKHRKVQHTVTFGTMLQGVFSALGNDLTHWTILSIVVGILITLIWVWAE